MNDMRLSGEVNIDTGAAQTALKNLGRGFEELTTRVEAGNIAAADYAKNVSAMASAVQRVQKAVADSSVAQGRTELLNAQRNFTEKRTMLLQENADEQRAAREKTEAERQKQVAIRATIAEERAASQSRKAELAQMRQYMQASWRPKGTDVMGDTSALQGASSQIPKDYFQRKSVGLGTQNMGLPDVGALNQTRYALYDVSTTLGVFGAAATAAGASAISFAAQYETAFTAVERTAPQASVQQLEELRQGLIALSESIPVAFGELAEIATLGSQLGIEPDELEAFTETVARFAAVTGIATSQVAQDFGALGELLDVPATSFENLASAINFTGINSVATDQEILKLATNIGASATQAGFAAEETIGLASALASLRIQPEQARGVILRLFGDIDQAVSEGGESLQGYARIMGETVESAQELWRSDAEGFFDRFIQGLQAARNGAGDLNQTLTDLGIVETRERNVLQRLAGNYEVYSAAIGDANRAYLEGTFLGDSYAKTQDDIATRIAILIQSVQNLLAEMGAAVGPAVVVIVDALAALVQTIGDLPAPVLGAVAAVALLTGGLTLLVAGGAALIASGFAVQTALRGITQREGETLTVTQGLRATIQQLTQAMGLNTAAARVQSVTLGTLAGSMRATSASAAGVTAGMTGAGVATTGATVAARGFTAALAGIPVVNILVALSAAVPILLGIADAMNQTNQAAQKAGEDFVAAGGGVDVLRQALEADTAAVAAGAQSFGQITLAAAEMSEADRLAAEEKATHTAAVLDFVDADAQTREALQATTEAIANQTYELGQNTIEFYKNAAAKTVDSAGYSAADLNSASSLGFDIDEATRRSTQDGGAVAYFEELRAKVQQVITSVDEYGRVTETVFVPDKYQGGLDAIEAIAVGMDNSTNEIEAAQAAAELLGIELGEAGDEGTSAADKISAIQTAIEDAFSANFGGEIGFTTAIQDLNDSLSETGFIFDTVTDEGRNNLSLLEGALSSAAGYGAELGLTTEESMAQAFASVAGTGEDIAGLLQYLASQPVEFTANLNISGVIEAYNALSSVTGNMIQGPVQLAGLVSEQYRQARAEATAASRASKGAGRQQKSNNDAQKRFNDKRLELEEKIAEAQRIQYETTLEYANAIGGIVARATSLRFDRENGLDEIASQWQTIRDRQREANQAIKDYRAELIALNAERNQQTYFLSVAVEYGDTLRGDAIRGEIAGIDKQIAEANKGIKESQAEASTSLNGNSEAARNNRAEVQSLANSYTELIKKYADSGLTTEQLASKTEQLRQDFIKQATQLGFSRGELGKYEQSFYDVRDAIATVPRNITVSANVNPAIQAMNEFRNKTDERVRQARKSLEDHIRAGVQNAQRTASAGVSVPVRVDNGALAKFGRGMKMVNQISSLQQRATENPRSAAGLQPFIDRLVNILNSGNYATGGVIGGRGRPTNRGVDDTLIMAQLGEGVVTQKSMEWLGSDGLDAINQQRNPFGTSAVVNTTLDFDGIMELGPASLNALVNAFEARGLVVQMDGVTVGRVIEKANVKRRNYGD